MLTKLGKLPAALTVIGFVLAASAGAASASPPADVTDGAATDLQTGITDWVTNYGLPMLVALMILGAVIAVLVKFGRKARNAV